MCVCDKERERRNTRVYSLYDLREKKHSLGRKTLLKVSSSCRCRNVKEKAFEGKLIASNLPTNSSITKCVLVYEEEN